jgi:hypothetical protein
MEYKDYFGIDGNIQAIKNCLMELGDKRLLKEFISIPRDLMYSKIEFYVNIVKKMAEENNKKELLEVLYFEGLLY